MINRPSYQEPPQTRKHPPFSMQKSILSDLIRHLRAAHFALLAFALLTIALAADHPYSAPDAFLAVYNLDQLAKNWPSDWIESQRPAKMPTSKAITVSFYLPENKNSQYDLANSPPGAYWSSGLKYDRSNRLLKRGLTQLRVELVAPSRNWEAVQWVRDRGFSGPIEATAKGLYVINAPATLEQFKDWWNKSGDLILNYYGLSDPGFANRHLMSPDRDDAVYFVSQDTSREVRVRTLPKVTLQLSTVPDYGARALFPIRAFSAELRDDDHNLGAITLFASSESRQDLKPWELRGPFDGMWSKDRQKKSFNDAFPELRELPPSMAQLPLPSLLGRLNTEAIEPKTIEFVGFKIAVVRWGVALLLLTQGYFLLLTYELQIQIKRVGAIESEVAWIAFFSTSSAWCTFLVSLAMPGVAVMSLCNWRFHAWDEIVPQLLSFGLALLTMRSVYSSIRPRLALPVVNQQ